jgi:16S rRNA (guanine1207-N2)-methyltransferase
MTGQYFEPIPAAGSRPRTLRLVLPDLTVALQSDRAVFASDRIDSGTRYLLQEVPTPGTGIVHSLDLGCGYGPIAIALAARAPHATVWAVDVNERAVELCRANAAALGLANIRASVVADATPYGSVPADVRFDVIWSNPPIRVGKAVLHTVLERWLGRLSQHGHAYLVVHRHLGSDSLQAWLGVNGWQATRLGSRAGYRILDVSAAPDRPDGDDSAESSGSPDRRGASPA